MNPGVVTLVVQDVSVSGFIFIHTTKISATLMALMCGLCPSYSLVNISVFIL